MTNTVYALIAAFLLSVGVLSWTSYDLRQANAEIEHLTNMSKQSDSLSLATIGTLQDKLVACQKGNYEAKVDSLPAPKVEEPKPVVKKKKARRAPSRRAHKAYEYRQPKAEAPEEPRWHWGLW